MSKATRKVRDKWRMKEWYDIYSPSYFGERVVASIPCEDPVALIGRVVETTLYDITDDFAHQSTKLYFLIVNTKEHRAATILKSHEYATDYLRSLVRRGSTRMDGIFNATTKDQYSMRISVVAFTRDRIKASQEHGIRQLMKSVVDEKASALTYEQLSQEIVLGKLGSDIYNLAKKIAPLRHVGVRKSRVTSIPLGIVATAAQIAEQTRAEASAQMSPETSANTSAEATPTAPAN